MIDKAAPRRLATLAKHADDIRAKFKVLLRIPELMQGDLAYVFRDLAVEESSTYITLRYLDFELRFVLFIGYTDNSKPIGRIVCVHRYPLWDEPTSEIIGTFTVDPDGRTNAGTDEWGSPMSIEEAAPFLALTFLDLAAKSQRTGAPNPGL